MRSLDQWLAYQAQVHPQAIDLGLERLRVVLERLEWRQPTVPVITVAGTNGKGSVSAYCAAILGAAGYKVGAFTSPHLRDYRERILIHDRLAHAEELVAAFEKIEAARGTVALTFFEFNTLAALLIFEAAKLDAWVLEVGMGGRLDAVRSEKIEAARGTVALTFFEFNTLAALLIFEAAKLDAWVLEVGMGGRLDAVNVVDPDVAVVTSIGLDHQEYLGTTLEAIAREKAGIFRQGRPAVLGSREMPAVVEELARSIGA